MSTLAAQLSQIAAKSSNELDLKAQKASHSQSLIFESKIAGSQDFITIFQICHEGFKELCVLDRRFLEYGTSIFSAQSRTEDRTQMTAAQNEELNVVLEAFLGLVGSRLLLKPAIKAMEWLIRRFRVHENNTSFLLLTFLPYHDTPIFQNLLSILPPTSGGTFKFLHPYVQSLTQIPRHAIAYSATTNAGFFTGFNNYVLKVCKAKQHYHGLLSFWSGITSEAVAGMLELAQSGRRELQRQKEEDVFMKVMPMLDEALKLQKVLELRLGCYMVITIIANKAGLGDKAINGLMESVVYGWSSENVNASLVCLSVLAGSQRLPRLPKKVVIAIGRVEGLENLVAKLGQKYNMSPLVHGFINGVLHRLEKGKGRAHISLVERLLLWETILDQDQVKSILLSLLKTAQNLPSNEAQYLELRNSFSDMLQKLNGSSLGSTLQTLIKQDNIDVSGLETSLHFVLAIENDDGSNGTENGRMAEDFEEVSQDVFAIALEHVPERTVDESSLLAKSESHVFRSLEPAFLAAASSSQTTDRFRNLPILRQDAERGSQLFWSFSLRILCGPYPASVRTAAIRMGVAELSSSETFQQSIQIIFPYIIFALADAVDSIRREACKLMLAFKNHYGEAEDQPLSIESSNANFFSAFYGVSETEPHWLSRGDMSKLISAVFMPFLEEFALDQNRAGLTVEKALRGAPLSSHPQSKASVIDLKKSIRTELFLSLKSYILNTPLYLARLRLLSMLKSVDRVGSISCGKEFLPLLKEWAAQSESSVNEVSAREGIQIDELEKQISTIISPNDKDTLSYWLSMMKDPESTSRTSFRKALFDRIQVIWPLMKMDRQQAAADFLFEGALEPYSEGISSCREVLQSVPLHTDVLVHLVAKVEESVTNLPERPSPSKRRRTSKSEWSSSRPRGLDEFAPIIQRMTFILELLDNSKPENHPALFTTLFDLLVIIQQFKTQLQSELAYVQNLALSSLLAIAKKSRTTSALRLDTSAIRADLIVDCIQHTQSHQVQNTALLLIASLACSAPDLVLHSVMPMFTFMGADILKHTDEYSTYVVDQTIEEVIPPLVQSLRDQKRDVITGTSELLHSFTAAFDHIPSYRRLRLFKALISKLGADDFLFAVLAILAEKYQSNTQVKAFAVNLALEFGLDVQLNCYKHILQLAEDSLKDKPNQAQALLGVGQEGGRDSSSIVVDLFKMLAHLLQDKSLVARVSKVLNDETMETAQTRDCLSDLVERILDLSGTLKDERQALLSCNDVLASLLGILSIPELIKTTRQLLAREDDDFRRKLLKLLEARIRTSSSNATSVFVTALDFLPKLSSVIESATVPSLRQAAVACVDQICEKYGKKNSLKVVEAAKVIAGDHSFGQLDERSQVISALCLASMTEILGEALVPVLPTAIPRALELLELSLKDDEEKLRLHNAIYSMLSAILAQLPWMVSGNYLHQLLRLSYASANAQMGKDCDSTRRDALQLLAKKVDLKSGIAAIESTWPSAVEEGPEALAEVLSIVNTVIEKSPKSAIATNAQGLRTLIFKAFDLRRLQFSERTEDSYEDDEVAQVETTVNEVAIKMIYKMNDLIFRPLFVNLVEWATTGLPKKDTIGRTLRLTTFYNFLSSFFSTLKSIVTSYAGYIIENAVGVLASVNLKDPPSRTLWQSTILTLTHSFEYDQDDFWQSPHHFNAISIPLISQFTHASTLPIDSHLIPALVALASAADSPDHHKALNSAIMKHMRDEHAAIRLAAVKTETALTEKLGEEWLGLLPEMLPFISEALEDDDEGVERETRRLVAIIEGVLGESLEGMLQ